MQLTSPTAIAADIAANAAGDQFGSGSGPSAQADFLPASGKADGNRYAEFACVKSGRRIVLWYDEIGGVWTTMNGGFSISRGLSNSPTRISIPTSSRTQPKLIEGVLQKNFSTAFASSGAPVRPTCSVSDGQSDDYYCVVTNTSTHLSILALYHVDATSGAVFSVKPGNTQSGQSDSSATASGPSTDLYQSCGDTVASFRDITIDLRTYLADRSNVATMHDDFTALSDDLQLMAQQAERQQHDGDVSTLQNAAAAYLADAEEVEISGQLQAPPADFASVLQKACPSSWSSAGLPSKTASTGSNASGSNSTNTGSTGNNGARTRASTHSAASVLDTYWDDINSGDYTAAYALETSSEHHQQSVSDMEENHAKVNIVSTRSVGSDATGQEVRVNFYTVASDGVCRHFSIDSLMVRSGSRWLYDGPVSGAGLLDSNAEGNPNCPS